jgi:SAM-dependent methyltransferase
MAQDYERTWWNIRKNEVDFNFYEAYARELRSFVDGLLRLNAETRVLEIGSGAGGIVTFLPECRIRFAIDPLEMFYSSVKEFTRQRDIGVRYACARGEELPFAYEAFDLVLMDNVLDHCENIDRVVQEVRRVLKTDGKVFFKQNVYHGWGWLVRSALEPLMIDRGHPHTLRVKSLNEFLERSNLRVIKSARIGYFRAWTRDLLSGRIKDFAKAALMVSRDKVTCLLQKE